MITRKNPRMPVAGLMVWLAIMPGCIIGPSLPPLHVESVLDNLAPAFWDPSRLAVDTPRVKLQAEKSRDAIRRSSSNGQAPDESKASLRIGLSHKVGAASLPRPDLNPIPEGKSTLPPVILHVGPRSPLASVRFVDGERSVANEDERSEPVAEPGSRTKGSDLSLSTSRPNPIRDSKKSNARLHALGRPQGKKAGGKRNPHMSPQSSELSNVNGMSIGNSQLELKSRVDLPYARHTAAPDGTIDHRKIGVGASQPMTATWTGVPTLTQRPNRIRENDHVGQRRHKLASKSTLVLRDREGPTSQAAASEGCSEAPELHLGGRTTSQLVFANSPETQSTDEPPFAEEQEQSPTVKNANSQLLSEIDFDEGSSKTEETLRDPSHQPSDPAIAIRPARLAAKSIWADRRRSPAPVDELAELHEPSHFRSGADNSPSKPNVTREPKVSRRLEETTIRRNQQAPGQQRSGTQSNRLPTSSGFNAYARLVFATDESHGAAPSRRGGRERTRQVDYRLFEDETKEQASTNKRTPAALTKLPPPVSSLTTDIGLPDGDVTENSARFANMAPHLLNVQRGWANSCYAWTAPALAHRPLYFEEVNLERYGLTRCGRLQPIASGAHFFGNALILPYHVGAVPAHRCIYTLGHYRPGSCVPYRRHWPPVSLAGAANQGLTVTTLFFAIP